MGLRHFPQLTGLFQNRAFGRDHAQEIVPGLDEGLRSLVPKLGRERIDVNASPKQGAAYRLFKEVMPDLVIMDFTMPGLGAGRVPRAGPEPRKHGKDAVTVLPHQNRLPFGKPNDLPAAFSAGFTSPAGGS